MSKLLINDISLDEMNELSKDDQKMMLGGCCCCCPKPPPTPPTSPKPVDPAFVF